MLDPEHYMYADLSITDIEGPAEFYNWEAEEMAMDYYDSDPWGDLKALIRADREAAPADDFGDELVEYEDPNDLTW